VDDTDGVLMTLIVHDMKTAEVCCMEPVYQINGQGRCSMSSINGVSIGLVRLRQYIEKGLGSKLLYSFSALHYATCRPVMYYIPHSNRNLILHQPGSCFSNSTTKGCSTPPTLTLVKSLSYGSSSTSGHGPMGVMALGLISAWLLV
jgi:hypothetical protein